MCQGAHERVIAAVEADRVCEGNDVLLAFVEQR